MTTRDTRLDVARGVAIVAIVLVHVLRGMHAAGLIDYSVSVNVDRVAALWCLNVFAFVGGALVPRSVQKRGVGVYIRDRVFRLLVIYVVWTVIQGGTQLLAADSVNTPPSVGRVLSLWHPNGQLWYLPFVMLVTVLFVPMQPWKLPRGWWILLTATVLSVAFWGSDGGYVGTQGIGLVAFMVAGMVFGSQRVQAVLDRFSPALAGLISVGVLVPASIVAVLCSVTVSTFLGWEATAATTALGVVLSVLCSAAILLFGQAAQSVQVLAMLGRRSLDIFLAHIIMAAGARIVLTHAGVTSVWVIAACGVIAGVLGSLLLGDLVRRIGLGWTMDGLAWPARRPVAPTGS